MVGLVSGNLSHPVYARQISAGNRRGLAGPSAWTQIPRLSLSPYLPLVSIALKIWISKLFHTASVQSSASNPKQTSTRLAHATPAADLRPGGRTATLIELILFMQQKCGFNNGAFNIHIHMRYSCHIYSVLNQTEGSRKEKKIYFHAKILILESGKSISKD